MSRSRSWIVGTVALALLFSLAVPAKVVADVTVNAVRLEGLRRTREEVVLDLLPIAVGASIEPGQLEPLRSLIVEDILRQEIFAAVEVTFEALSPDEVDLVIQVREKWTLIPLPFFTTDGASFQGGLLLLESNLLGRNKQLITAGFFSSDGFSGFLAYADPSIRGSDWSWRTSVGTGAADQEHLLPDGTVLRRYRSTETSAGLGVGYRLSRDVELAVGLRGVDRTIENVQPGFTDPSPPEEGPRMIPALTLTYDGTRRGQTLRIGPRASVRGAILFSETDAYWEGTARGEYSLEVLPRVRLRGAGDLGTGSLSFADQPTISIRDGFRTLPYQKVIASQWAAAAGYVDVTVASFSWGALVASHFWEAGVFDGAGHSPQPYWGPGLSFRVLLAEIALPALGIDVAWNLHDPGFVFSFALGMQP